MSKFVGYIGDGRKFGGRGEQSLLSGEKPTCKLLAILSRTGKYRSYYLRPENTGDIISDWNFCLDKTGLGYYHFRI